MQFDVGNYREFFMLNFWHNFWPRRRGGPANPENDMVFEDFACWSVFAMIENRGKSRVFQPEAAAKKCEDKKIESDKKNAKKKTVYIWLSGAIVGRLLFCFLGIDLAGPARQADVR